ncbi:pyridoxal phosphate homeostasis protein [Episyrphus balteatus]|uniref:pyridoxal phosphate homeostasis protein n=1 Tax=Episyrphus balteatus TaxID=286459 RepID=UPI002486CD15|nr:pyridoxal phosphate homeostasis protein [Episyrphus balteatus]
MIKRIMTDVDVKAGINLILKKIDETYANRSKEITSPKPLLVAVSKTKPSQMIIEAYSTGQRHFGENYVQELIEKGADTEIQSQCPDIRWHFIGHLQKNKINKIVNTPNLYMIETVDSQKIADSLNSALERIQRDDKQPLRVLVQINTSGEEEKNGVPPTEAVGLYKHISENLKNLKVDGLMTIGRFGHDYSTGPNPDFIVMMECHRKVCEELNLEPSSVQVSMGMSDDFDKAIEMGSTIVRVGSSIFGYRAKKNAA